MKLERTRLLATAMMAGFLALFDAGPLSAAPAVPLACDVVTPSECQITTPHDLGAGGKFKVNRTLHILGPNGALKTDPGSALTLKISGGLTIDAGGRITGDSVAGNSSGAAITITTGGAVLLAGAGTSGALISVDQAGGSCSGGNAGNITIRSRSESPRAIAVGNGARITANARCSAGEIEIAASKGGVDIRGSVESASTLTGTGGGQRPGGGPISISASCDLTISGTGRVSSRGNDPGADLVHLEAGGSVLVFGLVESTGPGHAVPVKPENYCAGQKRPDKPANATACVEVWAGKDLVIDGSVGNNGEINADTAQRGGHKVAWIDLFAHGNIAIHGVGAGPYLAAAHPYAVHANQFTGNSTGGLIAVKSKIGTVTLTGQAIQADGALGVNTFQPTPGGSGGVVTIEAGYDVDLGTSSVRARGANRGGGPQAGGDILVRSFKANVVGAASGELNADGGGGRAIPNPGIVSLTGCDVPPPDVSYGGTATPAATTSGPACGGKPTFPAYVVFITSFCTPIPCVTGCVPPITPSFCEKGTVKEVLDQVTGRFPGNAGADIVVDVRTQSLQNALDAASDVNNDGYIIIGVVARDGGVPGGQGYQQVDVTRAYPRPFALIGCGVTLRDPTFCDGHALVDIRASATSPEFPVGSGVTLYFQEITVTGSASAPGWLARGDGRFFEGIGAADNMQGMDIAGNGNAIHNSVASGNVNGGIIVKGDGNTVGTVQASSNDAGDGIRVAGNRNTIANSTAGGPTGGNGAAGIRVNGAGNLISDNNAVRNALDGIAVAGGTALSPNVVNANVSAGNGGTGLSLTGIGSGAGAGIKGNTTQGNGLDGIQVTGSGHKLKNNSSGGSGPNLNHACQYRVTPGNINATSNTIGSVPIPGANGSPFPTGCQ